MAITTEQIRALRDLTGAGIMDCKRRPPSLGTRPMRTSKRRSTPRSRKRSRPCGTQPGPVRRRLALRGATRTCAGIGWSRPTRPWNDPMTSRKRCIRLRKQSRPSGRPSSKTRASIRPPFITIGKSSGWTAGKARSDRTCARRSSWIPRTGSFRRSRLRGAGDSWRHEEATACRPGASSSAASRGTKDRPGSAPATRIRRSIRFRDT